MRHDDYDPSKPIWENRYPNSAWAYQWYEADEERRWRKWHPEDAIKSGGSAPAHRNPHPFPDATDCVYKLCACGESFLHPMGSGTTPDDCEACRQGRGAA